MPETQGRVNNEETDTTPSGTDSEPSEPVQLLVGAYNSFGCMRFQGQLRSASRAR
jgi:hypothetical protein